MEIEEARREIDAVDREFTRLFARRMAMSDEIGRIKAQEGGGILDRGREQTVLDEAAAAVPQEYAQYCVSFFQQIMALSRDRQRDIFARQKAVPSRFEQELGTPFAEKPNPRVVVQGIPGAYSSIAAARMYPAGELQYADRWEDALGALDGGAADYCVLPVENSTAGLVTEVYDLLLRGKYYIVKAHPLPVEHCLLGVRGGTLREVREILSHPHAFPQCSEFFRQHHSLVRTPCLNTAMAAQAVAKSGDRARAAIASRECARIYGLSVLADSVQDTGVNRTRFVSVAKRYERHPKAGKISITFTVPHVTGSLCRVLARFAHNGYNLTQIVSRPVANRPFEYFFYVDLTGSLSSAEALSLLGAFSEELPAFRFLGNYDEE